MRVMVSTPSIIVTVSVGRIAVTGAGVGALRKSAGSSRSSFWPIGASGGRSLKFCACTAAGTASSASAASGRVETDLDMGESP